MLADEPFRSGRVGRGQGGGPCLSDGAGVAVVDIGGGVHPDPGMPVGLVVPAVEAGAEGPGILQGAEGVGEVGTVLQGFELGFAEWVVVAAMRT